jgi:hypothetical protein
LAPAIRNARRWTWLVDSLFLFLLAAELIRPIYTVEYLDAWNSIESTFISDGRFLSTHWPHPGWQPNWYCGTRFDYIYPPAIRYGTAALSRWGHVSTARSYHLYIALLYSLGIAGVYLFVRAGSRSRSVALWTAVATALISPAFVLFKDFRMDYRGIYWMPIRLGALIRYGEGPHMSALALLPFSLAAAWNGVRRNHPAQLAAAAVFAALAVAHNFYGATALAILFPILVWSVWLAEQDGWVWARAAAVAALAWGLSAFWFTPSYVRVTLDNMKIVSAPGHAWSAALAAFVVAAYAALSFKLARGKPQGAWATFCVGALALMGLNVAGNQYFDFRVMGEPGRLVPELDLAILLAAGALFLGIARRGRWWRAAAVVLAVAALIPAAGYVRRAWRVLPPAALHEQRVEAVITGWVHQNLSGVRTLATGSVRFWYNAWYDLPQLGGGSEQGLLNMNSNYAYNHAVMNDDVNFCVAWMQAMGVGAVIVHDKNSAEIYHDWDQPGKFEGRIEKLYDDRAGNRIYRIPRRGPSLARVVDAARIRGIRPSTPEIDYASLARYVEAVERGPEAPLTFDRIDTGSIRIRTRLEPGQLLLVQETYDPAWKAQAGGRAIPIEKDALGFLLLDPGPGDGEILLRFGPPLENRVGAAIGALTLLAIAWLGIRQYRPGLASAFARRTP